MKQFVFTLQPLYDMKRSEEKQQKMALAAAEKALRDKQSELTAAELAFSEANDAYRHMVSSGTNAEHLKQYGNYFARIKEQILKIKQQILVLEKNRAKVVEKLVDIRKEIKLLDKLYEEQYAEHLDKRKKAQEALIGDIVSYRVSAS